MKRLAYILLILLVPALAYAYVVGTPSNMVPGNWQAYAVDPGAPDSGVTSTAHVTLKNLVTAIGTTKKSTIVFPHTGSGTTTQYTIGTALDLSSYSNITFQFENGAQLKVSTGVSGVTLPSPSNVSAQPNQQIMSGTSLFFSKSGTVYPDWFGAIGDNSTDDSTAFTNMASALRGSKRLELSKTYNVNTTQLAWGIDNLEIFGSGGISGTTVVNSSGISDFLIKITGHYNTVRDVTLTANGESLGCIEVYGGWSPHLQNLKINGDDSGNPKIGISLRSSAFTGTIVNPQVWGYFSQGIRIYGETSKPNGSSIMGGWVHCRSKADSYAVVVDGSAAVNYPYSCSLYGTYLQGFTNAGMLLAHRDGIWQPAACEGVSAKSAVILGTDAIEADNNNITLPLTTGSESGVSVIHGYHNNIHLHAINYTGSYAADLSGISSYSNTIFTKSASSVRDASGENLSIQLGDKDSFNIVSNNITLEFGDGYLAQVTVSGETNPRITITQAGVISIGNGTWSPDTQLSRIAPNYLALADGDSMQSERFYVKPSATTPTYTLYDGDVMYANGTGWNPPDGTGTGQGAGLYIRTGGAWVKLH